MKWRAAIFDVYGTLLEVGPAPPHAEEDWRQLWRQMFGAEPRFSRLDFSIACSRVISREHETARGREIAHPEINWPCVVGEVVPELKTLPPPDQELFLLRQIRTGHTVYLTTEAAEALRWLKNRGWLLGLASNAQAYTLRELQEGLISHGLSWSLFEPDLCFWSYQHGFSKPDPHVFQLLSARLNLRGISAHQTVMVGDRLDNDIQPAQRHGWNAWQLCLHQSGRGWKDLLAKLD